MQPFQNGAIEFFEGVAITRRDLLQLVNFDVRIGARESQRLPVSRAFYSRRGAVGFEFRKMFVELNSERRADDSLLVPD